MKKAKWIKGVALLLASVCCGTMCACDSSSDSVSDSSQTGEKAALSVWSTYNTMKVMQDSAMNGNYTKQSATISAKMAKNEDRKSVV